MYSPRQRDVRERRIHERGDERRMRDHLAPIEADEVADYDSPPGWGVTLTTRASAA